MGKDVSTMRREPRIASISTEYGTMMPQYEDDGVRRKYIDPLTFYDSGEVKSIELKKQVPIQTVAGIIPAEHLIFYPSGKVKRIFPLNGKLTGYWTEEDESALAKSLSFTFPFGDLEAKVIGVYFYDGGGIKSITLWPKERVLISSLIGPINVRIGISMYANGSLKSCEPAVPTPIETPIGTIMAYDPRPIGINADKNSLNFDVLGNISSVVTSVNKVEVTDAIGKVTVLEPAFERNLFDPEKMNIIPLHITLEANKVYIQGTLQGEYMLDKHTFKIKPFVNKDVNCSACANCTACD